jgi:hypothetical protein
MRNFGQEEVQVYAIKKSSPVFLDGVSFFGRFWSDLGLGETTVGISLIFHVSLFKFYICREVQLQLRYIAHLPYFTL